MPKRRKNRSIGEFSGNGMAPPKAIISGPASVLPRTEITVGFTFSTRSAKPAGRAAISAAVAEDTTGKPDWWNCVPTTTVARPRLATVASRIKRRVDRLRHLLMGFMTFALHCTGPRPRWSAADLDGER